MADSTVTFTGNLTRDPDLRFTSGGRASCNFAVAVSKRWKDSDDKWQEKTSFIDCVAWGDLAENIASSAPKGSRMIVTGTFEQHEWSDDDGNKRSKLQVNVDDCGPSVRFATVQVERNARKDSR